MTLNLILFLGLALVAIVSAIGLLASPHPVYSALYLILNFGTVAIFYLLLAAPFLALAQVTVYAGAIMVLFLFVIMLMGSQVLAGRSVLPWQRPVAFVLGAILVVETVYLLFFRVGAAPEASNLQPSFGGPVVVGQMLYNQYLLPFEVTSILLLVAMIGAIVLTRTSKRKI